MNLKILSCQTDWYRHAAKGKTPARQYYYYCYNYCQNHKTLKLSGWKACKGKTIYPRVHSVDLKLLFNVFFLFIQLISKDETPIPRWGKRLLGKGKNKFFRTVLFSVHSDSFSPLPAYFPGFNLSYSVSECSASFLYVSSSNLLEVLSLINYIFSLFFCCYSFKTSLWILLWRIHGTHYCHWRGDITIYIFEIRQYGVRLKRNILEPNRCAFKPKNCHLLAVIRLVHSLCWALPQKILWLIISSSLVVED